MQFANFIAIHSNQSDRYWHTLACLSKPRLDFFPQLFISRRKVCSRFSFLKKIPFSGCWNMEDDMKLPISSHLPATNCLHFTTPITFQITCIDESGVGGWKWDLCPSATTDEILSQQTLHTWIQVTSTSATEPSTPSSTEWDLYSFGVIVYAQIARNINKMSRLVNSSYSFIT